MSQKCSAENCPEPGVANCDDEWVCLDHWQERFRELRDRYREQRGA